MFCFFLNTLIPANVADFKLSFGKENGCASESDMSFHSLKSHFIEECLRFERIQSISSGDVLRGTGADMASEETMLVEDPRV